MDAFMLVVLAPLLLGSSSAQEFELTSYERSFTPYSENLSCYVCEPPSINLTGRDYVQWKIDSQMCLHPTPDMIQQCQKTETFKPRGCGKLVTRSFHQINFGGETDVVLIRRFCASSGMNEDERKCSQVVSQGRWSELCVCGGEACNGAEGFPRTPLSSVLALLTLLTNRLFS